MFFTHKFSECPEVYCNFKNIISVVHFTPIVASKDFKKVILKYARILSTAFDYIILWLITASWSQHLYHIIVFTAQEYPEWSVQECLDHPGKINGLRNWSYLLRHWIHNETFGVLYSHRLELHQQLKIALQCQVKNNHYIRQVKDHQKSQDLNTSRVYQHQFSSPSTKRHCTNHTSVLSHTSNHE